MAIADNLTFKQRTTWFAHLYKALMKQHHKEMRPLISQYTQNKDSIAIDVGAHAGQYTKLMATSAKHVISIEPGSYALSILQKVIKFRGLNNVLLFKFALGDKPGTFTLNVPIKASGSLGFGLSYVGDPADSKRPVVSETIEVVTLDSLVARTPFDITNISFIKADIEGAELLMLQGSTAILEKAKPALYIEIANNYMDKYGQSASDIFTFLKGYGYQPTDQKSFEKIDWQDFDLNNRQGDLLFT